MLTREQAIMIINQYSTKRGTFVFHFAFPHSLIPKDLEMENWEFLSALDVRKDELSYAIQDIIYDHLISSKIITREWNHIEFRNKDHITSMLEVIKFLEHYQNEYDSLEKKDDVELNEIITLIEKIRKLEYRLIDEAEILLKIKEDIDKCIIKWGKQISNKDYWVGV